MTPVTISWRNFLFHFLKVGHMHKYLWREQIPTVSGYIYDRPPVPVL